MKIRPGSSVVVTFITALALLASACKQSPKPEEGANQPAPKPAPSVPNIKAAPAVQAKAEAPKPGPQASKKPDTETFGKGKATVHINGNPHQRSFWAEQMDVDSSGNPVLVDEAWDNHDKILYVSNDRTFTCGNGETATGSTLMAVYAKGNTRKRPAGSGWWVTELHEGDCAVPRDDLYGCRFDPAGINSDCGAVKVVQSEADDIVITPLPQSGDSQNGAGGASSAGPASSGSSSGTPPPSGSGANSQ